MRLWLLQDLDVYKRQKEVGASAAGIDSVGWRDMSDNMMNLARFYEYGTYNASGKAVDTSERLVNESVEKGGTGMGLSLIHIYMCIRDSPGTAFIKYIRDLLIHTITPITQRLLRS